jgi:hypothetical protein
LSLGKYVVNNAWRESVKNTPFILNSGHHPTTPKIMGRLESRVPQAKDFAVFMQENLRIAKESSKHKRDRNLMLILIVEMCLLELDKKFY